MSFIDFTHNEPEVGHHKFQFVQPRFDHHVGEWSSNLWESGCAFGPIKCSNTMAKYPAINKHSASTLWQLFGCVVPASTLCVKCSPSHSRLQSFGDQQLESIFPYWEQNSDKGTWQIDFENPLKSIRWNQGFPSCEFEFLKVTWLECVKNNSS